MFLKGPQIRKYQFQLQLSVYLYMFVDVARLLSNLKIRVQCLPKRTLNELTMLGA